MSTYLHGTAVLGAISPKEAENIALTQRAEKRVGIGLLLGTAVATIGLASAWKSHRVLGGLLGLFLVGPVVGSGAGLLLSYRDIQKLRQASIGPGKVL